METAVQNQSQAAVQSDIQTAIKNADIKKTVKDLAKIPGRHIFSFYNMASKKAKEIEKKIEAHIDVKTNRGPGHREKYLALVAELRQFLTRECLVENIIVTAGRSVIAERLANDTTYTGIINYGALGTGTTPPTNSDTTLETEVFRKVVASQATDDATAFIDFFISKADWDGTAEEFATFIDGSASVGTGQMFTHALTGGWTKTALESMTIAAQYDIT